MPIENGDIIFGVVEKTVSVSQGGLVHVVFREKAGSNVHIEFHTALEGFTNCHAG